MFDHLQHTVASVKTHLFPRRKNVMLTYIDNLFPTEN